MKYIKEQSLITSYCACDKWLNDDNYDKVVIYPCKHIFHKKCYNKYNYKHCPWCLSKVNYIRNQNTVKNKEILNNLNSLKVINQNYLKYYDIINYLLPLSFTTDYEFQQKMLSKMFTNMNIKIKVINYSLLETKNVVYICNHTSCLDSLILLRLINTTFFASNNTHNNILQYIFPGRLFMQKDKNNVNSIKGFNKNNTLLIFPEGRYVSEKYINLFRSGAFKLDCNIQPIVITCDEKNVTVRILPMKKYPFNKAKIEYIRKEMADKSGLILSNVINKRYKKYR